MALPGVKTAVAANIRKNPVSVKKPTVSGDGGSTTTTSTIKSRASEGVRTATAASAENARTAKTESKLSQHYSISDAIRNGTGGAVRGNDKWQYGVPKNIDYSTFKPGLAGNGWRNLAGGQRPPVIVSGNNAQANMYAQLNNMYKAQMGAQIGKQVGTAAVNFLNNLGNIGGNENVYAKANTSMPSVANTVQTAAASGGSPLDSMKGADDSASLQSAITAARAEQSEITGKLQTLKGEIVQLENNKNEAEAQLEQLNKDIKSQEEVVSKKEEAVKTAQDKVKDAKQSQEGAKKGLDQATANMQQKDDAFKQAQIGVENAQTALSGAKTNLATAQSRLAATPPTLLDGSTNPAYAQAQQAVQDAQNQVSQKEQELTAAQEKRDQAAAEYKQANADQKEAQAKLDQSIKLLKHAETQQSQAESEVVKAKQEFETEKAKLEELQTKKESAEGEIKKYDDAVKEQQELEKQVAEYDKEIPKQEQRLEKLQEKENKEMKSLDGDISKLEKEIDDLKSKGKDDKANEKQTKLDGLNARKEELQNIINQRNFVTEMGTDGQVLKSGYVNGEQVFMIGDKEVSQAEFQAEKDAKFNEDHPIEQKPVNLASLAEGSKKPDHIEIKNLNTPPETPKNDSQFDINNEINILKDSSRSNGKMSAQGHDIQYSNGQFTIDGKPASETEVRKLLADAFGANLT